jgi:hypothetical protein
MQKRILLGVGIFGLVLVASCASAYYIFFVPKPPKPAEVEQGPNTPLPDNPIVFRIQNEPYTTLGFIDPDGGNFTTRKIDFSLTRDPNGYEMNDQTTWGPDGTFLVTRMYGGDWSMLQGKGIPVIITNSGETRFCGFSTYGPIWDIDSIHVLTTHRVHVRGAYQYQMVKLNMETCQIDDVIYVVESTDLIRFATSSDGWIAYDHVDLELVVLDDQQREAFRVDHGRSPNWSRDGEWLAYSVRFDPEDRGQEGITIVRRDGSDKQLISRDGVDPWWSPDGEWLVYWTYAYEIYKININTKEKVLLYSGGSYPTWR